MSSRSAQETANLIVTPMPPSQPVLDICDQRFLCRMAKMLGCQFCAKEQLHDGRESDDAAGMADAALPLPR